MVAALCHWMALVEFSNPPVGYVQLSGEGSAIWIAFCIHSHFFENQCKNMSSTTCKIAAATADGDVLPPVSTGINWWTEDGVAATLYQGNFAESRN